MHIIFHLYISTFSHFSIYDLGFSLVKKMLGSIQNQVAQGRGNVVLWTNAALEHPWVIGDAPRSCETNLAIDWEPLRYPCL